MAVKATLALKAGVWFRRVRFVMISPDSRQPRCRSQAENPLIVLSRFPEPALSAARRDFEARDDRKAIPAAVVTTAQRGKGITTKYLAAALAVLGNDSFRYGEEWYGETSAVLEFFTAIDGVEINGADFIGWNSDGRIDRFKVMVRPLKAM